MPKYMDKITKTLISATFIIAVGMPMVSSAAIPACPIPNDGGVRVNFTNAPWLLAADYSNWQHETSVYSINLSAGNYQVTLASYDDHPNAEDQQHEQFFVSLLNGGSLVKNSVASPDLPQNITMGYWNVGTISLPTAVNGIKAVHAFYPNGGAESIVPICATFVKISGPVQPPTVDIKANSSNGPITVANGSEVVLSWVSANAISCSASGSWNGVKSLNNSETSSPLTSTSVFGITCINSNGQSVFDSVTVNVSQNNSIGVTIIANPTTVNQGGSSTLTWTTTNAVSCFADGGNWSGSKSANGSSEVQNNLQATQVYGITCVNSLGNSAHASATVNVIQNVPDPTVDIKANSSNGPITIPYNTQATLSWVSQNATECHANGGPWTGPKPLNNNTTATNNLTSSVTFTITCTNAIGASDSDSVTINVGNQQVPPTVDIKANSSNGPITIAYGTSATLSWVSTDADYCTASGAWSGNQDTNSSKSTGTLFSSKTYTITCYNTTGSDSDSVTVNVSGTQEEDPTVDIKANSSNGPITIPYNTQATLSWVSQNATECHANGGPWTGPKPLNNNTTATNNLTSSVTFTITCTNAIGASDSDSVTINVGNQQVPPTVDIKANSSNGPITIAYGTSATLSWVSTDADYCTASGAWSGNQDTNSSKSTGTLFSSKTYTITCYNTTGSDSDSVTVNVSGTQEEDPTVDIKANSSNGPITIPYNTQATLSWVSQNATECHANGGPWTGPKPLNNNTTATNNLTSSVTFTINCTNAIGASDSDSVTINVGNQQVPPTVDIKANSSNGPITIAYGTSATLSWVSTDADYCTASGAWSGNQDTNSSKSTGTLFSSKTYTITCYNTTGSDSDSVTVNVSGTQEEDPTVDLVANPTTVTSGNRATLSWTSSNADYCYASGGAWSGSNKPTNSSEQTNILTQTSTLGVTIICVG